MEVTVNHAGPQVPGDGAKLLVEAIAPVGQEREYIGDGPIQPGPRPCLGEAGLGGRQLLRTVKALSSLCDGRPSRQVQSNIVNLVDRAERTCQLRRVRPFAGRWHVNPDGGDPAVGADRLIDSVYEADNGHASPCELLSHPDNSCGTGLGQ